MGEDEVVNENGLRNNKEFVNHKILDLVGDFMLSGFRIVGRVSCYQGGHQLTNMFLRKLLRSTKDKKKANFKNISISEKLNTISSAKVAINA